MFNIFIEYTPTPESRNTSQLLKPFARNQLKKLAFQLCRLQISTFALQHDKGAQ